MDDIYLVIFVYSVVNYFFETDYKDFIDSLFSFLKFLHEYKITRISQIMVLRHLICDLFTLWLIIFL
jgi:hypothetical protein